MLYAGIVNSYYREIKNDPIHRAINLQRPSSNFESSCFLTKDSDSIIDIKKAKSKIYYNIYKKISKFIESTSLRHWCEINLVL